LEHEWRDKVREEDDGRGSQGALQQYGDEDGFDAGDDAQRKVQKRRATGGIEKDTDVARVDVEDALTVLSDAEWTHIENETQDVNDKSSTEAKTSAIQQIGSSGVPRAKKVVSFAL
jgi:hypothetical protein